MNTYFLILLFSIFIFIGTICIITHNEKLYNFDKSTKTQYTYDKNKKIFPSQKFLNLNPQDSMFRFNRSSLTIV